jgi:hypothetical protein
MPSNVPLLADRSGFAPDKPHFSRQKRTIGRESILSTDRSTAATRFNFAGIGRFCPEKPSVGCLRVTLGRIIEPFAPFHSSAA